MLTRMVATGEKYEMIHGLSVLRDRWHALATKHPLYAFLVAAEAGRTALAKDAARLVINLPNGVCTQYIPELESAPALPYHRLLVYYSECHAAVKGKFELVKIYCARDRSATGRSTNPEVAARERRSPHAFLERMRDSSVRGVDGIICAVRSLLPGYIRCGATIARCLEGCARGRRGWISSHRACQGG